MVIKLMHDASPATEHAPSPSAYLWLATVPLIWGSHFVFLKIVYEDYTVMGMLSLRYLLMSVALWVVLWVTERDLRFDLKDVPYLAFFSLLMVTIYQVLFALAIQWSSAGESALLISTAPIFTAFTAAILGWERLTRRMTAGIALGFAGITAVILGGSGLSYLPPTHVKGCLVMVVSAVLWAWYAVLAKPLLSRYSPVKVTTYCHTLGGIPLILLGAPDALHTTPQVIAHLADPLTQGHALWVIAGILFYAWLSGSYAFTVWYRAVQRLGSGRTMMFQYCVPVVGLLAAIVFRREYPSLVQWVGVALTLCGVFFAAARPQVSAVPVAATDRSEIVDGPDTAC